MVNAYSLYVTKILGTMCPLRGADSRPMCLRSEIGSPVKGRPDSSAGYYIQKINLDTLYGVRSTTGNTGIG